MVILGEVDKAFVDVISQSEDGQQNSSFASSIVGRFARVGAIKQVEGELKEVRVAFDAFWVEMFYTHIVANSNLMKKCYCTPDSQGEANFKTIRNSDLSLRDDEIWVRIEIISGLQILFFIRMFSKTWGVVREDILSILW